MTLKRYLYFKVLNFTVILNKKLYIDNVLSHKGGNFDFKMFIYIKVG